MESINKLVGMGLLAGSMALLGCGYEAADSNSGAVVSASSSDEAETADLEEDSGETDFDLSSLLPCLEFDKSGTQIFKGEPTSDFYNLDMELAQVIDDWDVVAGLATCSHFEGLAVFLKVGADQTRDEINAVGAKYPDFTVVVHEVPWSRNDLIGLRDKFTDADWTAGGIVGIEPDLFTGGLSLTVKSEANVKAAKEVAVGVLGIDVPIRIKVGTASENAPLDDALEIPNFEHLRPCLEFDVHGSMVSYPPYSQALEKLNAKLEPITQDGNKVTGTAFCSHYDGVAVFIKAGVQGVKEALEAAAAEFPQYKLYVYEVPYSMNELTAMMEQLHELDWPTMGITSLGPDMFTGGLTLSVESRDKIKTAKEMVVGVLGDDVPVRVDGISPGGTATMPD